MSQAPMCQMGLYVHIPFCARRCDYCDFFVVVAGKQDDFFVWLRRDLELGAAALGRGSSVIETLYFGGGTPSSVDPDEISRFIGAVSASFGLTPGAEITLEANPESVTPDRARAWLGAGVNRLSLGVQSFHDEVLPRRGRLYDAARVRLAVEVAREAGVSNLGIDLIAGLPGETPATFGAGIEQVVTLRPEHVSIYLLETDDAGKQTALTQSVREGRERLPTDEEMVTMYTEAMRRLSAAGYRHYEISNLARPGLESRHNLKYWMSEPWLGVGPSAHSHVGGRRFARPADLAGWTAQVRGGRFDPEADDYTLPDPGARAREALLQELRLIDGVDLAAFARRWTYDPSVAQGAEIDALSREGLLQRGGGRLALTPRGVLLSNEVFERLM